MKLTSYSRVTFIVVLAIAVLLMLVAGCGFDSDNAGYYGDVLEIKNAPIHEVRINIAESYPQQVFVYIKGGLVDGCTTLHDIITERSGNIINITVTTQRPREAICTQVYGFFEENVALGSDFTPGETYTVNVNRETASFEIP